MTDRLGDPFTRNSVAAVWLAVIGLLILVVTHADFVGAASSLPSDTGHSSGSVSFPLEPKYVIERDGAVTLRICFNWSCARRQTITFTSAEMDLLRNRMATCPGKSLHDRLQRVRIGVWQMELLAERHQPLLANDRAINDFEVAAKGRMDCVDNSTNTTTYLKILQNLGELPGWVVSMPRVRNRFEVNAVHWTAVIVDTETGRSWSVDSWYRPNGHLPMVMPLESWMNDKKAWEPPFQRMNPTPSSIDALCETSEPDD